MDLIRDKEINGPSLSADLIMAKKESDKLHRELQASLDLGKKCQTQAKWIGLDGYVIFYFILLLYI